MFPTDIKTWILYVLLTVLLGAIGSGFWETAFKPSFAAMSRFFIRVLMLGLKSSEDALYRDIARRSDYKPIFFLIFISLTVISLGTGVATHNFYQKVITSETTVEIDKKISKMSLDELKREKANLASQLDKSEKILASALLFMSIFLLITTSNVFIRSKYIASAILHFDQCLTICLPYINVSEERHFMSEFAQIATKSDFIALVVKIEKVATDNSLTLPKFALV